MDETSHHPAALHFTHNIFLVYPSEMCKFPLEQAHLIRVRREKRALLPVIQAQLPTN